MNQLTPTDLHFVVSRIPHDVVDLMKKDPVILAGGFIRSTIMGEKPSDVDLFGKSEPELKALAYKLSASRKARPHETKNAITVLAPPRLPVQFITRWTFDTLEATSDSFDFTICQAAIRFHEKKWESHVSEGFYPDLAARRLVYTSPSRNEDAGGSILRVRKFLSRGFNIQAPSLAAVISQLMSRVNFHGAGILDNFGTVVGQEQLTKVVTGLLRLVDPNVAIDGIDLIDEHQVLNEGTA